MCGIAGVIGVEGVAAEAAARRMLAALGHRGPDGRGLEAVAGPGPGLPPVVLAQTRLAILDPSPAGRQPMAEGAGGRANWIVFNGEVFNFGELAGELAAGGLPAKTRCDTEMILHAYRAWGLACPERMRGMFAWCLVDPARGTAWLCRDRLGVKPLYLSRPRGGGLLFASEVRALLAAGPDLLPARVDPEAVESFLAQGGVWGEETFVRGVTSLGPGESLLVDWSGRTVRHSRYWQLPSRLGARGPGRADRGEAVGRVSALLRESVKLALVSDVPLGLFLSGGVDSGALLALADEVSGATVETLTVGFERDQARYDESALADEVASRFGTRHHSVRLTDGEVLDTVPRFLDQIDQPTSDGLNTHIISAAARRAGLKVALSGLGSDEMFGGYPGFLDVPRAVSVRAKLRWARRLNPALARVSSCLGGRRGAKGAELFRRDPSLVAMYLLRREQFLPEVRRLLHPLPVDSDPASGLPRVLVDRLESDAPAGDPVNRISWLELTTYTRDTLLRDTDVFAMAHGLEVRVPYLDHRLVEEVLTLPAAWKRPDPRRKPLLVDSVGPRLPSRVYTSGKQGFEMPIGAWLRGPLRPLVGDTLNDRAVWSGLGFNPAAPPLVWSRFLADDPSVGAQQMFSLVVLAHYVKRHGIALAP